VPERKRKPGVKGRTPGGKERCGEGICGERVHLIDGGGADPAPGGAKDHERSEYRCDLERQEFVAGVERQRNGG